MHDITSYLALASQLARDAVRYALNVQKSEMQVQTKTNMFDLVNDVDNLNEEFIRNAVLSRSPEHSLLGEESGTHGDGEVKWIVDPIDGTVNFAHGLPIWCVSIGVE